MAGFGEGVRGIEDVKVALLVGNTPGAFSDFVGVKGLSAEVTSDSDEQKGDDEVIMIVQENKSLDITLTSALANLAVLGLLSGVVPVSSGTTPNQVITWKDPAAASTAYVEIVGQGKGRDANNSALRMRILKAQLTGGPNWDFSEGAWLEPELTFTGIGRGSPSYLYEMSAYETKINIA
ncbi:MAG: hypothetical protein AVDCRST_MAG93-554 [uncultured Chloroflexia bacterium]|uniref:Phage major tail protein n=1 Tax=uncultured Chloroflexia bacterium TaxID=1672391 RepID=A0A6J4HFR9_9CHLR|nr:MAG: hypothetical protein AVDCRST_MAG93-554 [uncultured Chloroflexia bacterium]